MPLRRHCVICCLAEDARTDIWSPKPDPGIITLQWLLLFKLTLRRTVSCRPLGCRTAKRLHFGHSGRLFGIPKAVGPLRSSQSQKGWKPGSPLLIREVAQAALPRAGRRAHGGVLVPSDKLARDVMERFASRGDFLPPDKRKVPRKVSPIWPRMKSVWADRQH